MRKAVKHSFVILLIFGAPELLRRLYGLVRLRVGGVQAYQKPLTSCIKKLSKNYPTFIDVGAAEGDIIEVSEKYFDQVVAIEPSPHHIAQLKKRKHGGKLGNTKILEVAVSNKNGSAKLGLSDTNPDDNSLFTRPDIDNYVVVKQQTLDKIIRDHSLKLPALIKMDIQGFEGHALKGAKMALRNNCSFLIELWPWGLWQAGTDPNDLLNYLASKGYAVKELTGRPYSVRRWKLMARQGKHNPLIVDDVLLVKKDASSEN